MERSLAKSHKMKIVSLLTFAVVLLTLCSISQAKSKKRKDKEAAVTKAPLQQLHKAVPCKSAKCKLPDCRCSGAPLPKSKFKGKEQRIPQFVTISFDDAVNAGNYVQYVELFGNITNPDNCTAAGTFFVTHDYTDYVKLNALYNAGHEIALHSVTHGDGTDYWRKADVALIEREYAAQLIIVEKFGKVNPKDVHGMRLPFLQISGNNSFVAARRVGLLYDSSMPTQLYMNPAMWPYTLDYMSVQDCQIEPCPTAAIPGIWVAPMVTWEDMEGFSCSMIDACVYPPADEVDAIYAWMLKNFMRHYKGNRAPFGMYLHAAWFARGDNHFAAFKKFMHFLNSLPDVYLTTISRMLQYVQQPVLGRPFNACPKKPTTSCKPVSCSVLKTATGETRYMSACDKCPDVYPWLDNPLGKNTDSRKKYKILRNFTKQNMSYI